jgi:hypothetical protein
LPKYGNETANPGRPRHDSTPLLLLAYFVTSVSYTLAQNLVDSIKVEIIGNSNNLGQRLNIRLIPYTEAISLAFGKIEQNQVISSWRDAMNSIDHPSGFTSLAEVPVDGCFTDKRHIKVINPEKAMNNIWSIGGQTGRFWNPKTYNQIIFHN